MGKLLCSKSANSRIKPTSYCRIVENMLIVCSKYIRTVTNLPMYVTNISRCCGIRMYEAVMPHFKCFFFLTILFYAILFSLYDVLYLTILVSYHQFYCTHLLFVIFFSVMIQLSYWTHLLKRGMMFTYYAITNVYTSFDIATSENKAAGLEPWLVYINACIVL